MGGGGTPPIYGPYKIQSLGGNFKGEGGGYGGNVGGFGYGSYGGAGGYLGNGGAGGYSNSASLPGSGNGGAGGGGYHNPNSKYRQKGYGGGTDIYGEKSNGLPGTDFLNKNILPLDKTKIRYNSEYDGCPGSYSESCENIKKENKSVNIYGGGGSSLGSGAVRIIWGENRFFPSTNVGKL
jgi:hypothetical protein